MNMEEILDQKLAELKEKNSENDLLSHEKVVEFGKKMHESLNPGIMKTGPEVIKLFSCSTQFSVKFQLPIKDKMVPTIAF